MSEFSLAVHGLTVSHVLRNPSPATLYEESIRHESHAAISDTGALIAHSGEKTGRSPKDKRIVKHPDSEQDIWWGPVNFPLEERSFMVNRERAVDYLNTKERLYCVDGFAGWDPATRIKVRVVCARPYHALFMINMLIRPTDAELEQFGEPDLVILNAGGFPANRYTSGMTSKTSVDLSIEHREVVLLGTDYAGEMKKAVFTYMNYAMPKQNILSMHCSATADPETQTSAVLFGLSGTGKTTLSADPARKLVGDDEHCWSDTGIFNIEGGCYAKAVYLTREAEPQIFDALRFGAVLENVVYDKARHHVDFGDTSITENTRGAYPIEFIENAQIPCVAGHPNHVIFLTCDAFGVLPPVSRLSPEQAEYHFISGYTAKIAGTEMGVTEPQATFSPCFGGPFLVWHPGVYARLLSKKIREHRSQVWLVNTGWTGGAYGEGQRISLKYTRAILNAVYSGRLADATRERHPTFGLEMVTSCPGVPTEILNPRTTWKDPAAYDAMAADLSRRFRENFSKYADGVTKEVISAGPV
ncbi:phosphoenolpyruvate carboxykinase (ATP) [Planctomicrobium sp. SH664]|uniref:phosphoenolpyruvate carboxykinase (ATP) n=1 Tax=Planctomicrobium sp. SH664 TaxID=3448125 RepID=UPI003F5C889D